MSIINLVKSQNIIFDNRALILHKKKKSYLFLADLHLGIEHALKKADLFLPSQTKAISQKINHLIKKYSITDLVLLGDVKHNLPSISWNDRDEIPEFVSSLLSKVNITVVAGNHDGSLQYLLPEKVKLCKSSGCLIEQIGCIHGHSWPGKKIESTKIIFSGHIHPKCTMISEQGEIETKTCWIYLPFKKEKLKEKCQSNAETMLIFPPFNPLILGVNVINKKITIGPFFRNQLLDLKKTEIILENGFILGQVPLE